MFHYLVKEDEFLPAKEIDEKGLAALDSEIRRSILELASESRVSVKDVVKELGLKDQATYYHVEKLLEAGLLEAEGRRPRILEADMSAYYFRPEHAEPEENPLILGDVPRILEGFVENRELEAKVVVGAPHPHGEHDRRHKAGYKAADLGAVLGNYGRKRGRLVFTDTEIENRPELGKGPLISIAGPLVNTLSKRLNGKMDIRFSESYDRVLTSSGSYAGDEIGFVVREDIDGELRMLVAGLYGLGTSAAIEALSSRPSELGDKGAVVRGFGTKQDIEEVEIVEKL